MRASEKERFWTHVVKGPEPDDCWFWSGAIGDDGYGRFWTHSADAGQRAVRPQRYAYELLTRTRLLPTAQLLHRCDVPLCVRAAIRVDGWDVDAITRAVNGIGPDQPTLW